MIIFLKLMGAVVVIIGVVVVGIILSGANGTDECQCDRCRTVRDSDKS